jgi:riboflavin synthase
MFTGIIRSQAKVERIFQGGRRIAISMRSDRDFGVGDSIAVNGVCLTVMERQKDLFFFALLDETLRMTNLGLLKVGDHVNIEPALRAGDPLGGHIILGHVDGMGKLLRKEFHPGQTIFYIELPIELSELVVKKGSIAIDGISLTVADINGRVIQIALTEYTLSKTALGRKAPGDLLNIEVDIIGKYIKKFTSKDRLSEEFLKMAGF